MSEDKWGNNRGDSNMFTLYSPDHEVAGACIHSLGPKGWCALDHEGNVLGYSINLEEAKAMVLKAARRRRAH